MLREHLYPVGVNLVTWTIHGQNAAGAGVVRPIIGTSEPVEGIHWLSADFSHGNSGSWATPVESGEITVKLEYEDVLGVGGVVGFYPNSITWTLMVFPDTAPVPAVGTWGVAAFALLIVATATVAFRRFRVS